MFPHDHIVVLKTLNMTGGTLLQTQNQIFSVYLIFICNTSYMHIKIDTSKNYTYRQW